MGTFHLFDPDVMNDVNLNRTVGAQRRHARARTPKVDVAEAAIKRINSTAHVVKHRGKWEAHHWALRMCDAVVGGLDGFSTRDVLEKYCRRYHVPYIDIGMDVHRVGRNYLISGQVIASLPGGPCMRCLGFLTDELIDRETQAYGVAGGRPQVIWSNGVLASTAVGMFIRLRCDWTGGSFAPHVEYDGNQDLLRPSRRSDGSSRWLCPHFSAPGDLGDGFWGAADRCVDSPASDQR